MIKRRIKHDLFKTLIIISFILLKLVFGQQQQKNKKQEKNSTATITTNFIRFDRINNNVKHISRDDLLDNENNLIYVSNDVDIKYWTSEQKQALQKEMEDLVYSSAYLEEANENDFNYYYKSLLSDEERQYYDIFSGNVTKNPPESTVTIDFNANTDNKTLFIEQNNEFSVKLYTVLIFENPEIWWYGDYSRTIYNGKKVTSEPLSYSFPVKYNLFPEGSKFSGYTPSKVVLINKRIEEVKNRIMAEIERLNLTTDYAKLRYIHDYLVIKNVYTLEENIRHIRTLYGSLVEDRCVCEAYAEAFQYLARQYNINVISAISSTHKWNFVQMTVGEEKKWYIVDVTWDDPGIANEGHPPSGSDKNLGLQYFITGRTAYKTDKAKKSHTLVFNNYNSNYTVIEYPTIEESDYQTNDAEKNEIKVELFKESILSLKSKSIRY